MEKRPALNPTAEFGITSDSELIAEHRFKWKTQEFIMIGVMLSAGIFLAVFVKPPLLGLMFVAGALGMAALNFTKKRKSLIQLYQTPHGLKLYKVGVLLEEANSPTFKISDVRQVTSVRHGSKDLLLLQGWEENPITGSPYIKVPYRMIKSEAFSEMLKEWYSSSKVKFSKDLAEELKYMTKYEKAK